MYLNDYSESAEFELNKFADQSESEFKAVMMPTSLKISKLLA